MELENLKRSRGGGGGGGWGGGGMERESSLIVCSEEQSSLALCAQNNRSINGLGFSPAPRFLRNQIMCRLYKRPSDETENRDLSHAKSRH